MKYSIPFFILMSLAMMSSCDTNSGSSEETILSEDFSDGSNWTFTTDDSTANLFTIVKEEAMLTIEHPTGNDFASQLAYTGDKFTLKSGESYIISFDARGTRFVNMEIQENDVDINNDRRRFTSYIDKDCDLIAENHIFSFEFTMPLTDDKPGLVFDFGREPAGQVYLDNIKIRTTP
ncbi:hypothetical protein [Oceanispirochaeta sp.]|uniref:hypothetical protein n=1 Tax=Oceanispirochaeta sp. TaxID=2035350 RepID=UPI00261B442C|nr:hypothetical protein [Oceanispirochaeta sp.]MDA3956136.1 hypothetical protein [Oceanispirochaeta sp.]